MIKPDRVLALRTDRTVFQYAGRCVKVYSRSHPCTDILLEAGNLAAAREAGVNTPEFIEVSQVDGRWALVTDYVHGESLARKMMSGNTDSGTCLMLTVKAQIETQSACAGSFRGLKDALAKSIAQSALEDPVKTTLADTLEKLEDGDALCHGNFIPENLLVPDNGIQKPVILDWKRAGRGSADADAAASWIALNLEYGRETAQKYLELYCSVGGACRKDIMQWVPVMAASRLTESDRSDRRVLSGLISETVKNGGG